MYWFKLSFFFKSCFNVFKNQKLTLFFLFFLVLIFPLNTKAADQWDWQISPGDQVTIFAAKKSFYEIKKEKYVEAQGNVVIVHLDSTVYGDRARLNLTSGLLVLNGNVRVISKQMTLYGSELNYLLKDRTFKLENAKLFTNSFSLVAHKIEKMGPVQYRAEQAEFSACFDCPESWSVYGEHIQFTIDDYVYIHQALIRVKGSDVLYLPYLVFPIKRGRETGWLFPRISSRVNDGLALESPFFWAINPYQDLTVTPILMTKRGQGAEAHYRAWLTDHQAVYLDDLLVSDKLYEGQKEAFQKKGNNTNKRYQAQIETFNQYSLWGRWSFFTQPNSDLDLMRDYFRKLYPQTPAPWTTDEFLWQYARPSFGESAVSFTQNHSLLRADESAHHGFDKSDETLVQRPYQIQWGMSPQLFSTQWGSWQHFVMSEVKVRSELFTHPTFNSLGSQPSQSIGVTSWAADPYYRSARSEVVDFKLTSNLNPSNQLPSLKTELLAQSRNYALTSSPRSANVNVLHLKNSFTFEFEKIYGVAKTVLEDDEEVILTKLDAQKKNTQETFLTKEVKKSDLLKEVPEINTARSLNELPLKAVAAYRHEQQWEISHEYLLNEWVNGPSVLRDGNPHTRNGSVNGFKSQLQDPYGWFDVNDALYHYYYTPGELNPDVAIRRPGINQLNLTWTHSLIQKTPNQVEPFENYRYLTDQFTYTQVATASISQGAYLDRYRNKNALASLQESNKNYLSPFLLALNWSRTPLLSLSLQESYFHQDQKNIASITMGNKIWSNALSIDNSLWFNDYGPDKRHNLSIYLHATERTGLGLAWSRDLKKSQIISQSYRYDYSPLGKCWYASFGFAQNLADKQFTFDFGLNFDGKQVGFSPLQ